MITDHSPDLSPASSTGEIPDIVYALAASPHFKQDGLCFAARRSGLYRSDDGGLSWQEAYRSLKLEAPLITTAVALSPNFGADRTVFAGVPGAILRSVDGGETWQIAPLPAPPPFISALVISPGFAQDGTVFAGTLEDGVFRSSDGGSRWAAWNFGLLDLNILSLAISPDFTNDETLFAGTESGIFRSTNGGRAWREVGDEAGGKALAASHPNQPERPCPASPTDFAPILSLALSPHYAADGVIFAGTEACGLFYSSDRGQTWSRLAEEVIAHEVNSLVLAPEFPARPDVLALLSDRALISRDGGHSWSERAGPRLQPGQEGPSLVTAIAPQGLDPDAPLLVGLASGEVLRL